MVHTIKYITATNKKNYYQMAKNNIFMTITCGKEGWVNELATRKEIRVLIGRWRSR